MNQPRKLCGIRTVLLEHLKSSVFHEVLDLWEKLFLIKCEPKNVTASGTLLGKAWNAVTDLFRTITLHEVTLNSTIKPVSVYRDWNAVVELYSLGKLSRTTDKLVALSGLASTISIGERNDLGDGYLAGLWQLSLPSHLLWITEKNEGTYRQRPAVQMPQRYESSIAPSWSWASIDGKISFT